MSTPGQPATDEEVARRMLDFLAGHTTLALATVDSQGAPWAASLFYAERGDFTLYFVSEAEVLHSRNVAADRRVSGVIADDRQSWHEIQGLQLAGTCELVADEARQAALEVYLAKFPFLRENAALHERLVAENLYAVRPAWLRLIDNRRGFGFKEELCPAPEAP